MPNIFSSEIRAKEHAAIIFGLNADSFREVEGLKIKNYPELRFNSFSHDQSYRNKLTEYYQRQKGYSAHSMLNEYLFVTSPCDSGYECWVICGKMTDREGERSCDDEYEAIRL